MLHRISSVSSAPTFGRSSLSGEAQVSFFEGAIAYRQTVRCCAFLAFITHGGAHVNWDSIEGSWKSAKGKVREQWGKLTDDDLDVIAGKRDQLVGTIQSRYGKTKDEVEQEVTAYERQHSIDAAASRTF